MDLDYWEEIITPPGCCESEGSKCCAFCHSELTYCAKWNISLSRLSAHVPLPCPVQHCKTDSPGMCHLPEHRNWVWVFAEHSGNMAQAGSTVLMQHIVRVLWRRKKWADWLLLVQEMAWIVHRVSNTIKYFFKTLLLSWIAFNQTELI